MSSIKTPVWEVSAGALRAFLVPASGVPSDFGSCDQYTISLANGLVLRYTTSLRNITYGGNTWLGGGLRVDTKKQKAVWSSKVGLDVDTWQVMMSPRDVDALTGEAFPDKIGDIPWNAAVTGGLLNGAKFLVDRAYYAKLPMLPSAVPFSPIGAYRVFTGKIGVVVGGRATTVINANSYLELLDQNVPVNLFQRGCTHILFDAGCQLTKATFRKFSSVSGGDNLHIQSAISAPLGSGTYALGQIIFTSGKNTGLTEMISDWTSPVMTLRAPMPFNVEVGDTFDAYPGCDLTLPTCIAFGNRDNFGGDPFTPDPEVAA